jgi:hypothetical protein
VVERIYYPSTNTIIDLSPVIATRDALNESKADINIEKELSPDRLERSGTQVQKLGPLQIGQQNERNLTNAGDDALLTALKNRGVSPNLVQQVAAELLGNSDDQLPVMNEEDLRQLAKQTKANPWSPKPSRSPSEFIAVVYKEWLGKKRLMRGHLVKVAPTLMAAYATEIRRHPNRRIRNLGERVYTHHGSLLDLPPAVPTSAWIPTAELTEEQKANRRLIQAKKQRDHRAKERVRPGRARRRASKPSP